MDETQGFALHLGTLPCDLCGRGLCPRKIGAFCNQPFPHSRAAKLGLRGAFCAASGLGHPSAQYPAKSVDIADLIRPIAFNPFQALVHMFHTRRIDQITFGQTFGMAAKQIGQ